MRIFSMKAVIYSMFSYWCSGNGFYIINVNDITDTIAGVEDGEKNKSGIEETKRKL